MVSTISFFSLTLKQVRRVGREEWLPRNPRTPNEGGDQTVGAARPRVYRGSSESNLERILLVSESPRLRSTTSRQESLDAASLAQQFADAALVLCWAERFNAQPRAMAGFEQHLLDSVLANAWK
jgi:hypothetical protein